MIDGQLIPDLEYLQVETFVATTDDALFWLSVHRPHFDGVPAASWQQWAHPAIGMCIKVAMSGRPLVSGHPAAAVPPVEPPADATEEP